MIAESTPTRRRSIGHEITPVYTEHTSTMEFADGSRRHPKPQLRSEIMPIQERLILLRKFQTLQTPAWHLHGSYGVQLIVKMSRGIGSRNGRRRLPMSAVFGGSAWDGVMSSTCSGYGGVSKSMCCTITLRTYSTSTQRGDSDGTTNLL